MDDMKEQQWLCPVKPEEIPAYLNWVAQDSGGDWCGYENEPKPNAEFLMWVDYDDINFITSEYLCTGEYNANWRNTLQKVPR